MNEIIMPKAGMDMQEGRLLRWLKEVGDVVQKNEPIIEIETDKTTMESEAPADGILLAKLASDGDTVPVLQIIGYVGAAGEKIPERTASQSAGVRAPAPDAAPSAKDATKQNSIPATPYAKTVAKEHGVNIGDAKPGGPHGEVRAADVLSTPLAKRIAGDRGIDLISIAGTGHGGKVRKEDVLASAVSSALSSAHEESRRPIAGARKVIGKRMLLSHAEIPVVTMHMKVYVDKLLALRKTVNEGRDNRISVNDMMIKIIARAVREYPVMRTSIDGGEFVVRRNVNIGFAVGMDEGLLVPVIRDADTLSLSSISVQAKDLAKRARAGGLRPEETQDGCFTISNMGVYDIFAFTPIINLPESGILGVCAVQNELARVDGEIIDRQYMMISLTFDHRIMDGAGASAFQLRVKELIENPMEAIL